MLATHFNKRRLGIPQTLKQDAIIGLGIGFLVNFVIIFLEPFNTDSFNDQYRLIYLSGYGAIFFFVYLIFSTSVRRFSKTNKQWSRFEEVILLLVLVFFAAILSRLYLVYFIRRGEGIHSFRDNILSAAGYFIGFAPLVVPFTFLFKKQLSNYLKDEGNIVIRGSNKDERISLHPDHLIYVKSAGNYVQVYYQSKQAIKSATFRSTLNKVAQQAPFLQFCHRSTLVNLKHVSSIEGNSQKSTLLLSTGVEKLVLSKSYYKEFKSMMAKSRDLVV